MKLITNLFYLLAQLIPIISLVTNVHGQQDFNHFATLKAAGVMPLDFSTSTEDKIQNDIGTRTQLSGEREKIFLKGIHYSIDELLHSGLVIYGDEISLYVAKVANNLLKNDHELKSRLRFYTLKSNATNAFSTDQGIVFVTTGLISQLTSESQLAYVLAHEISHYTQHHVVETFDYTHNANNKQYHDRISKLSTYSKEKEFEADRLGIKMYQEAGYSKNDLLGCFDVLLYAYLPFEDVEVPMSYFNTGLAYIPEKYFAKEKYPIKAEEDQDDEQSTHPNIRKRKEAAAKEIENLHNWDNQRFIYGEQEFMYIRDISRFESVRTDIIDAKFVDALYSILILEQTYPSSEYLARMKAHAWLGFAQLAYQNKSSSAIMQINLEGEIAAMHYLFRNINKSAIGVIGLRHITDLKRKYPENIEIGIIWQKMVKTVAREDKFTLSKFSNKTFSQAAAEFSLLKKDTVPDVKEAESYDNVDSKYERIRKKKDVNHVKYFDSTSYHLYMLSDLMTDSSEFKRLYTTYKSGFEPENKSKDSIFTLSKRDQKYYAKYKDESQFNQGINDLIIIQPTAVVINGRNRINLAKSQQAEENMITSITDVGTKLNMNVKVMNTTSEFATTTDEFNYRSRIFSYIEQKASNDHENLFPVDFEDLDIIKSRYNTSNIALMHYKHDFKMKNGYFLTIILGFFPALITYPMTIAHGFQSEFHFVVIDISTGETVLSRMDKMVDANNKSVIKARIYSVFQDLQKSPKNLEK